MATLSRIGRWTLLGASGALLVAMTLLTVVDVVGRYVFNAPLPGAFEATEIMLALAIFAGLPIVTARRDHVRVGLVVDRLPAGAQKVVGAISDLLVAALLLGAAILLFDQGEGLARFGDTTVLLRIKLAPVAYALSLLCAVSALVAAVRFVDRLRR
ncbi:MAG: TRAP transporter small permease [Pseudomonadota bacterium]